MSAGTAGERRTGPRGSASTRRELGGVSRSPDKFDVFYVAHDGRVYTAAWEPGLTDEWRGWWQVGDLQVAPGTQVSAVSRAADELDIFCTGVDGRVYTAAWEPNRGGWRGWWPVGALQTLPGAPVSIASRSRDKLDVFCTGLDGFVHTAAWEPGFADGWRGWWRVGDARFAPGSAVAAAVRSADRLDIACIGSDGAAYTAAWEPNTPGWRGWWRVGQPQSF